MKVALFFNPHHPPVYDLARKIHTFFSSHGREVVTDDEAAPSLGASPLSSTLPSSIQWILSLGGDGTLLTLVHRHPELDAPILGINTGHLGFMADVQVEHLYPSLNDLIHGEYRIEERMVLEGHHAGVTSRAVNEFVLHRSLNPCLIKMSLHVNGVYLNTFEADGVIVATPNGSTAYSLAAGGPLVSPSLEAVVITPICPHTISNRPLVLAPDHEIQIQYLSEYEQVEVRADGLPHPSLATGDCLYLRRSLRRLKLVKLARQDYFSTLRTKLGWSGKLR